MPRPAKLALALLLTTAILLEAVLQIWSLGTWLFTSRHERSVQAGQQVVMCVGDSYTHGMGSSSTATASYPAQLERILRDNAGDQWRVINKGYPGRNSRRILELIDGFLETHEPRAVCVLIGANDTWSLPEELVLDESADSGESEDSFRLEYRTAKLMSFFWDTVTGSGADSAQASAPEPATPVTEVPTPPPSKKETPYQVLARGDLAGAEAMFLSRLGETEPGSEWEANLHRWLAEVYARWGDTEKVEAELSWLREARAKAPSLGNATALLDALNACGRSTEALELARATTDEYPDSSRVWCIYALLSSQAQQVEEARRAIDIAVTVEDPPPHVWQARARIWGDAAPEKAVESAIRAYADDGQLRKAGTIAAHRGAVSDQQFEAWCADLLTTPAQREALRGVWFGSHEQELEKAEAVYAIHLRQIVARCQGAGARVGLLTYPHRDENLEATRRVARDTGADLIEIRPAFTDHLANNPGAELFVPDMHCNDAGYRLMAEVVARRLLDWVE